MFRKEKKKPPLRINGERKKSHHSALTAKLQHIYTWSQETAGPLVRESTSWLIQTSHTVVETEIYPISHRSKAKLSFFLHQAVVPGCPAKRHRHQAEMVSVENSNKQTAKESEDLWAPITASEFSFWVVYRSSTSFHLCMNSASIKQSSFRGKTADCASSLSQLLYSVICLCANTVSSPGENRYSYPFQLISDAFLFLRWSCKIPLISSNE